MRIVSSLFAIGLGLASVACHVNSSSENHGVAQGSGDQSGSADAGTDAPIDAAPDAAPKVCCVCEYGNNSLCARTDDRNGCETGHPDCECEGDDCVDRHKGECQEWLDEQMGCDTKQKVPEGTDPDLEGCTEVRYDNDAHGPHDDPWETVQLCISSGVCEVNGLFEGCSEFSDLDALQRRLEEIRDNLPEGTEIEIDGNQCISSDGQQTGQCHVEITCTEITIDYPDCGGSCFRQGETQRCDDAGPLPIGDAGATDGGAGDGGGSGDAGASGDAGPTDAGPSGPPPGTDQICCCDPRRANKLSKCEFVDGDSCPGETGNCNDQQYDCGNGTCINKSYICDNANDCSNGSDERGCSRPRTPGPACDER